MHSRVADAPPLPKQGEQACSLLATTLQGGERERRAKQTVGGVRIACHSSRIIVSVAEDEKQVEKATRFSP